MGEYLNLQNLLPLSLPLSLYLSLSFSLSLSPSFIARLATLIKKRSGGLISRGQARLEAREQIMVKSMRARAEAADRILRQERAAVKILNRGVGWLQ